MFLFGKRINDTRGFKHINNTATIANRLIIVNVNEITSSEELSFNTKPRLRVMSG